MEFRQHNQTEISSEVQQMESALTVKARERARVINFARRGLISDNEAAHELELLKTEVAYLERQRDELISQLTEAENSELRILTAETMLSLLTERAASADDNMRRKIVCALVDRIAIETTGDARPLARVAYVFRPLSSSSEAVDSVEVGLATSRARFTES